jgi:FMN reductase
MNYLVISSSLHPGSRSRILARRTHDALREHAGDARWLDAAELGLPLCDGGKAWEHAGTRTLIETLQEADGIVLAGGVYNYSASAAAKTLVELGGKAWSEKVVGLVVAAGGQGASMAILGLANALMLDFRAVIVPRFVYASGAAFDGDAIVDEDTDRRCGELAAELARMTAALRSTPVEA